MNVLRTVALGAILLCASCLSTPIKKSALFPAAQLTWTAIVEDLDRGIEAGVADGDLDQLEVAALEQNKATLASAIAAADTAGVRSADWSTLEPWTERGIDAQLAAGEIGPGVAESLREQLVNFSKIIEHLEATF